MSKVNVEIVSEERDYDKYLKIDKATVKEVNESGEEISYNRYKLTRPDAVAVVIYNIDNDTIVLVKQHRYPIHSKVTGEIFEIVAGKMDEGEEPKTTAIREIEEEVGYKVPEDRIYYRGSFFASPGYSSEIVHLYAASVKDSDKISDGGGLQGEHENIEIFHVPVSEVFKMLSNGSIVDAKTIIGIYNLWHLQNDDRVNLGLEYYEKSLTNKENDADKASE
jgi:nudix-type nucleoside diphosphatase (YffH/AdpP family)